MRLMTTFQLAALTDNELEMLKARATAEAVQVGARTTAAAGTLGNISAVQRHRKSHPKLGR